MTLTQKEQIAIRAIAENGLDNMGGSEPKDLHNDNFSWFDIKDLMLLTSFNRFECAGLISALDQKGLIGDSEGLYLTPKGIDAAQDLFECARLEKLRPC